MKDGTAKERKAEWGRKKERRGQEEDRGRRAKGRRGKEKRKESGCGQRGKERDGTEERRMKREEEGEKKR